MLKVFLERSGEREKHICIANMFKLCKKKQKKTTDRFSLRNLNKHGLDIECHSSHTQIPCVKGGGRGGRA